MWGGISSAVTANMQVSSARPAAAAHSRAPAASAAARFHALRFFIEPPVRAAQNPIR